ncbi:MAG: ADOP family duplicated permease [Gemmatimonadales bacterium]
MSSVQPTRPPRLARRLIEIALPSDASTDVIGDLDEVFHRTVGERGAVMANLWYLGEAFAFAARFTWYRASRTASSALRDLGRDASLALRKSARKPGFAAIVVLMLASGIGANVAVYRLMEAVSLRSLPVDSPDRLMIVELADLTRWEGRRTTGYPALSNALWERIRDGDGPFEATLAWANASFLPESSDSPPMRGLYVSGGFFDALGIPAGGGRVFRPEDDRPGCGVDGVVISHAFWNRAYGGDASVIGRPILLDGHAAPIIGVTPAGFTGLEVGRSFDVAVPICAQRALGGDEQWLDDGTVWWLTVMGRAPAGRSIETVNAGLAVWSESLFEATLPSAFAADQVSDYLSLELRAVSGAAGVSSLRTRYGHGLAVLLGVTALVFLLVCSNLANLFLSRGTARQRELAVRRALGASRGRLLREMAIESALLAAGGAATGALIANFMSEQLLSFLGTDFSLDLSLGASSVAFVAVLSAISMAIFGLWPAWRASGAGSERSMIAVRGGRGTAGAGRGAALRRTFVVTQVATSFVLLLGALLFTSALRGLLAVDPGFDPVGVSVARVDFRSASVAPTARPAFKHTLLDVLGAVPGVTTVAEVRHVPLGGTGTSATILPSTAGALAVGVPIRLNGVTVDFLETMGMAVVSGRGFTAGDERDAQVAVITASLAQRAGLGPDPVGSILRIEESDLALEVIGMVDDAKYFDLREEPVPTAFLPKELLPDARSYTDFMIRSSLPQDALRESVRNAVASMGPSMWVDVRPLADIIGQGVVQERLMSTLSLFFGVLASLVAAIGLYGVLSQHVAQRRGEIGVRIALGAGRGSVLRMVLLEGGVLVLAGLALGATFAFAAARPAQSVLFGLSARAAAYYLVTAAVLAATAVAACYLPARRAVRIDPRESFGGD